MPVFAHRFSFLFFLLQRMSLIQNPEVKVIPLFSSPLAMIDVTEDCSKLKEIITGGNFHDPSDEEPQCSMTKSTSILNQFPEEKKVLFEYFNNFKNSVLNLEDQEFTITTSWGTKTPPGGSSKPHFHANSYFSGVFYFDDTYGSEIQFLSNLIFPTQLLLNEPKKEGIFNSRSFAVQPYKNLLILFPSYLFHRIVENTFETTRYSLAFNLFPTGSFGVGDSRVTISV